MAVLALPVSAGFPQLTLANDLPPESGHRAGVPGQGAPRIAAQPETLELSEGALATFSVIASGDPSPEIQWQKDGVILPGQTAASLRIAAVAVADSGAYTALVRNSAGSVVSEVAQLNVAPFSDAPAILVHPRDTQRVAGQQITLEVAASGTPEPALQWLRNGVELPGETSTTLSFVAGQTTAGRYSVVAANGIGVVESAAADIEVETPLANIALIVRDTQALRGGERRIRNTLLALGHSVITVNDSDDLLAATTDSDLIVIPGTARAAAVGKAFVRDSRPIWVSQYVAFDDLALVADGADGQFGRVTGQQSIDLVDNQNTIGAGLSLGELQVIDRDRTFAWATPPASARVVATISGEADKASIFSFDRDDELADGTLASGRRVAWFGSGYAASRWTGDAVQLFEQSIGWLLDPQPGVPSRTLAGPVSNEDSACCSDGML